MYGHLYVLRKDNSNWAFYIIVFVKSYQRIINLQKTVYAFYFVMF